MQKNIYQRNLVLPAIKIAFDIITIELAIIFSYWLRFSDFFTQIIPLTKGVPGINSYIHFSFFLTLIYLLLFGIFQTYRTRMFNSLSQDIPVVFKVCFIGILFGMSGAFLYRDFSYSRLVFLFIFINTNIFLIGERVFFHQFKKLVRI